MGKALTVAALLALVACQTPAGDWCDITKPMRLSHGAIDAMSDADVAAVLAHNRKGQAMCGWRP